MTDRVQEIRARLEAATPGPWSIDVWFDGHQTIRGIIGDNWVSMPDAQFISNAPADIAYLLRIADKIALYERALNRICDTWSVTESERNMQSIASDALKGIERGSGNE